MPKGPGRSITDFEPLYDTERKLIEFAREGTEYIVSEDRPDFSGPNAPENNAHNRIRACLLRFLALGGDDSVPVHERGIRVKGAYITGPLDLEDCKNVLPLILRCCWLDDAVIFRDARMQTISLDGSRVKRIDAKRATVEGSVYLRHNQGGKDVENPKYRFKSDAGVNFIDAHITGSLECHSAEFGVHNNAAILASRADIGGSVFLHQNFNAKGAISFRSSVIGGNLECYGGDFCDGESGDHVALNFHGAQIKGSVYFGKDGREAGKNGLYLTAKGEVRFVDATIGGSFECQGANIQNPDGIALYCSRVSVKGSVLLKRGFNARGGVVFRGAEIGGNFQCDGGTFRAGGSDSDGVTAAISCHGAQIFGSVYLRSKEGPFRAKGEVHFIDTSIGGSFECHGAFITNPAGKALYCSRAKINGSVILYDGFRAKGEVIFRRADIKGNLEAYDATIKNGNNTALSFENAHIAGAVILVSDDKKAKIFRAFGQVNFSSAEIEGDFNCNSARICNRGGWALVCERSEVGGKVSIGAGFRAEGEVSFEGASIGGILGFAKGSFLNPLPRDVKGKVRECENALNLRGTVINGDLWFGKAAQDKYNKSAFIHGSLDLRGCRAAVLIDDVDAWPNKTIQAGSYPEEKPQSSSSGGGDDELACFIHLNGFTYSRLGGRSPLDAGTLKKWLGRQNPADLGHDEDRKGTRFKMQPFEQLVTVLRETGNMRPARELAMFKLQCQLRRDQNGPWWRHPTNWLRWLGEIAVGYGYRWQRVLYATFAVWALFSLFYLEINRNNGFCQVSSETEVCVPRTENPKNYDFNAALYSMQALLVAPKEIVSYVIFPKAKIQPRALNLDHIDRYKPSAGRSVTYFDAVTLSPDAVEYAKMAEIFFGWAAALMLMAVATDMIKRE